MILIEINLRTKHSIFRIFFERIRKPKEWTAGTMNRCEDGMYVVYADYDLIEEDYLKGELKHFQELMNLGDFLVFQSSPKKFHAICLSKVTALEYVKFLENSSVDEVFKKVPRFVSYRNWVLRAFSKGKKEKPKYLYTLENKSNRQQSYAHYKLLNILYPDLKIKKPINSDGLKETSLIKYKTGNV